MEDFIAGFEETADRYGSAADWIQHHLDTSPIRDRHVLTSRLVAISAGQSMQADRTSPSLGRSSRG